MREIKFRAWCKEDKCMYMDIQDGIIFSDGSEFTFRNFLNNEGYHNFEIMQYTGLKDKNGTEIYEGDIIEFTYWWFDGNVCDSILTGVIVYSDVCMSFMLKGVKNKEWEAHTGYESDANYLTPFSELDFCDADFNIIGNIYENPELL